MAMDTMGGIRQRTAMASGGSMASGDFGVKPLDHSKGPIMTPISDMSKGHVGDGDRRGAGKPVSRGGGKMASPAKADHGPHGCGKEMS